MQTYILLFRGINVGGNNILPMKEFVPLLKTNGFTDAYSYIQSGNITLSCDGDPVERVKTLVNENYGFSPEILVFNKEEFTQIQQDNPYQVFEGKFVHFYFCRQLIDINLELVNKYIDDSEQYSVKNNVLFLHAPNGIGRSKFVANIEACLGQCATGRNLNTVNKLTGHN